MKKRILIGFLVSAMFSANLMVGQAQQTGGQWSTVQAIPVDERLIVKQKDGKTVEGKMIEATDTNLTLSRSNKIVNISRANISQIQHSTGKAAKGKWAAIGAGVGAGAGAGIGATKYSADRDDSGIWIGVGTIFGAGAGAIAGLVIGANQRKRTLIYSAP